MNNFTEFNKVYVEYFTKEFPARSCTEVACLPKDRDRSYSHLQLRKKRRKWAGIII